MAGQNFATTIAGEVSAGQVAVSLSVTLVPQMLVAVTVSVSIQGPHELVGTM